MQSAAIGYLGLLGLGLSAVAGAATQNDVERVIRTTEGFVRERAPDELRSPFLLEESRTAPGQTTVKPRESTVQSVQSTAFGDAYVFEASTELFHDLDQDGYYHYLRVQFDADTVFDSMRVYAKLFLSADGTAWEHLYTTDDFRIWGSDPNDDYEVETELVSGYSTGQYDLLIELYDSEYGDLLDEFGPLESTALSLLPLEDSGRDGVGPPPVTDSHGGGGAASWPLLASLAAAAALRRRRPGA
jgi:hypothetical protein